MIVLIIILSGIYIALITFIAKTYYTNIQDLEAENLVLEKRIQEYHKHTIKVLNDLNSELINLNIDQSNLEKRIIKLEKNNKTRKTNISKDS